MEFTRSPHFQIQSSINVGFFLRPFLGNTVTAKTMNVEDNGLTPYTNLFGLFVVDAKWAPYRTVVVKNGHNLRDEA